MAVKDVFIPFNELRVQVAATEIEPMSSFCRDFFACLAKEKHPSGHKMEEMYFLPYPFQRSFAAHCVDYTEIQSDVEERYNAWWRRNAFGQRVAQDWVGFNAFIRKHGNRPLPVYVGEGYTFNAMREGRLDTILTNCITPYEFSTYANSAVVIDQDRTNFIIDTTDKTDRPDGKVIHLELRTHVEERFASLVFDGIEEAYREELQEARERAGITKPSTSGNITLGGTRGKIMVTTVGEPLFGKLSRQYLMVMGEDQLNELKDSGLDEERIVDKDKIVMVDFGEAEVIADENGNVVVENVDGETLHEGTTMYVAPWREY